MRFLTNTLQMLRSAKGNRRTRAAARKRSENRVGIERLEERALLAGNFTISDATVNEIGSASAFVAASSGGLSHPQGLTIGPDGNLYVASAGTNSVIRFNSAGQSLGTFVAANSGGLVNPYGLAFGPDGNLYVGGSVGNFGGSVASNAIYRYDGATGTYLNTFVPAGSGGLTVPIGMVFGQDGNLYVSSRDSDSVLRYQGPSGAVPGNPMPSPGQSGATFVAPASGGLDSPFGLVFGPDGNLYVGSTTANPAVLKYDGANGNFISAYVAPGAGGLTEPRGLAFDQDGRLYVADEATSVIHRFDNQGRFLDDPIVKTGTSLRAPVGMIFDAQGTLLISSRRTHAVVRYDRGVVVALSAASPTSVSVDYATADGIAGASGDYSAQAGTVTFAPGQTSRRILLVTRDDVTVESNETFTVQLSNATGGATIADNSAVVTIVDDDDARQITITDAVAIEGDHSPHYRGAFVDALPGMRFLDLTFGPDGMLYTSLGPTNGPIDRYDGKTGAFVDHFIRAGVLNGMRDIVFRDGYMYVGSEYTDEVFRFNANTGVLIDKFVTAGSGGIDAPHGLTFGPDANGDGVPELYVTGRNSFTIVRYNGVTGQPMGSMNTSGAGALSWPENLTVGPGGVLYVASTGSSQIQKYNAVTGAYLGAVTNAALTGPKGVRFGPDGMLYVTSSGNDRILRFTASGNFVDDYVPAGSGGMDDPSRIEFGPDG